MRKTTLFVSLAVFAFATNGAAQDDADVDTVNEPVKEAAGEVQQEANMRSAPGDYGSAGCGLGSLLFDASNGFTQVFAATTNGTFGTQTFGITSGTSNCDGAGYSPGGAAAFIQTNRAALAKDAARGKGATITGLTDLAGCKSSKAVGKKLQKSFTQIFSSPTLTDQQVSQSVIDTLRSDQSLACQNLS
jgi:hypothetical protein